VFVLAYANAVSIVLFGTLYLLAGAGMLGQIAFLLGLAVIFVLTTVLWVRTEARHRALDSVRRLGRVVLGLVVVVVGAPLVVLMPVFWLESKLPPEAGFQRYSAGLMAVVLVALALTVAVNVVGGFAIGLRAIARGRWGPRG
jgi:hypothetical protein